MRTAEAIGVDIGGTRTRIAVVAGFGILPNTTREFPTADFQHGDRLVHAVRDHAAEFQDRGVRGIGVCVPGLLRDDFAAVEFCPNTPVLAGYPLLANLRESTGLNIALEVDCNAAALAESRFGEGIGSQRVVVISLGTGVGIGVVHHGIILRLTGGCCGDLGHVYVGGDRKCSAGCRGCLESNVSVEALACGAEPASAYVATLIQSARSGQPVARAIFEAAGRAIGIAAASISSFLRPDVILLAGGISEAGACLVDAANRAFVDHAAEFYRCQIRIARFGANAALIGAAAALLEES